MSGGYKASSIGFSLVLAILIGAVLGWLLADYTGKMYWFYIGLILGIIAGFRNLYLLAKQYEDQSKKK